MKSENLEKIVTLIESSNKNICLFLGAGADISSGGKIFSVLKKEIIDNYSSYISDGLSSQEIDKIFEEIVDTKEHSREILLDAVNENSSKIISDGYKIMALLAKYGFLETIITTNFFDYLEKTEKFIGESIFDYYVNDNSLNADDVDNLRNAPKYLKLHGDTKHFCISHVTNDEINNKPYSNRINTLVANSLKDNIVIFIGYSGSDAKVTELIISQLTNIEKIYWINPKLNEDSVLVKKLIETNKLVYNDSSFDEFITKIGAGYLSKIKLNDSHPILIHSLLKSNTCLSSEKLNYICEPNVERDEYSSLKNLKKVNVIIGKNGIGKTYLIKYFIEHSYKVETLYLDLNYDEKIKILDELVSLFGFVSETPFSLLYNICSWYNSQKKHLALVVDSVNIHNKENFNEFVSFIAATKRLSNIYFIISSNSEKTKTEIEKLFSESDYQIIKMAGFSSNNVEDMALMLNVKDFSSIIDSTLLTEPYICSLVCNYYSNKTIKNNLNVFEVIEDSLSERFNMNPFSLHEELITIAKNEYENISNSNMQVNKVLISLGLIDSVVSPVFKYDKFREYYLQCYLFRNDIEKTKQKSKLYASLKDKQDLEESLLNTYICYYSFINSSEEATIRLLELNELLKEINNDAAIYFVRVCLDNIFSNQEKFLVDILNKISFSSLCYELQRLIVERVQLLENDNYAYILLKKFQDTNTYVYELAIYSIDRFCEKILCFPSFSEANNYYTKYKNYIFTGTSEVKTIKLLYLLMRLDNCKDISSKLSLHIIHEIKKLGVSFDSQKMVELLSKYSYNILFNTDSNLESKFSAISYKNELLSIIKYVISGHVLTFKQYQYLVSLSNDIDNMFIFLVSNLIVTQSMLVDYKKTLLIAKKLIQDSEFLEPQNIDFIISSVFMGLYHVNPYNRKDFVSFFEYSYQKFEIYFFEQPTHQRTSSAKKFSDEFSRVFEDGFNPLAFLFYTSVLENPDKQLHQYWDMCENLSKSGNISKILKIVHALGQMISIYPDEGFKVLNNVCIYEHEIIKKGLLRIMQEALVRYPVHTKNFITSHNLFTEEDIRSLYGQVNESFTNRTLEQLHWSRLLFSAKSFDSSIICRVLTLFCETNSLSQFIQELFCPNNL